MKKSVFQNTQLTKESDTEIKDLVSFFYLLQQWSNADEKKAEKISENI